MNYKIIEILKTFSVQDLKSFDRFLHSPYFNESNKMRKLYQVLIKHYPGFDSVNLTEENVSRQLNPDLPYNKSTFKSLLFEVGELADKFLTVENLGKRKFEPEDFLRDEYFRRKLNKYFQQNIEKTGRLFEDSNDYVSIYFLHFSRLYTDMYNNFITNKPKTGKNFISGNISLLSERAKMMSIFFIKELRSTFDNLLAYNRSFDVMDDNNFVMQMFRVIDYEELMTFLINSSNDKIYSVMLELNLASFRLLKDTTNDLNYTKYKNVLVTNSHVLGEVETSSQYFLLVNYCTMRKGELNSKIDFNKELFNIYKYIIHKKYYRKGLDNYLPVELFRAIVKHGFEIKKFKWTLKFIKENYTKLHPDRKMNMYYFSLAEYFFRIKKFDEAMRNFNKIELNHFMLKVDLKCLVLMTFYELGLFENALSNLDAFKHFLTNNNILSASRKKNLRAFISVIQNMISFRTSVKAKSKFKIIQNLIPDIPYKSWIDEKMAELDEKQLRITLFNYELR